MTGSAGRATENIPRLTSSVVFGQVKRESMTRNLVGAAHTLIARTLKARTRVRNYDRYLSRIASARARGSEHARVRAGLCARASGERTRLRVGNSGANSRARSNLDACECDVDENVK